MTLELYGTRSCPYTSELRAELDWQDRPYVEYDVDADAAARERLVALIGAAVSVPVLVEDGRVVQIGWKGQACYVATN
jgi:mycoredoxin